MPNTRRSLAEVRAAVRRLRDAIDALLLDAADDDALREAIETAREEADAFLARAEHADAADAELRREGVDATLASRYLRPSARGTE